MAARLATLLVAVIVGATLIAGLIVGAQREDNSLPVDVIIHNAKVYQADDAGTIADAVAIRGNKIVHVGSEREIMRYRRKQTNVIDAKGAAVIPGFADAHVSLIEGGLARDGVQLFGAASLDEVKERVTAWVDAHPEAPWVIGGGWSYDLFADLPTRAALDVIVSDRPARLVSQDGQALWVNTKALEAAGISKRAPAASHGQVVVDRRRQPTGLLRGDAMALVDKLIPKPTREERAHALQVAIKDAQSHGVTSVQDLGAASGDLDLYDDARGAETLGLRVYAAVPAARTPLQDFDAIGQRFPDDPVLKTGIASVTADGEVPPATLAELAAQNWQLAIEANDEPSVHRALDELASVVTNGPAGTAPRHRIEGLSLIDPDDMPRFGALGVVASMQPLDTAGGVLSWIRLAGADRAPFGWPVRSLSAAGAHLAFGSDWPRLPLDPLASIRAVVHRTTIQGSEQLTLKSAVNAWTSGPAWASFDDQRKGTIKPGMLADLVVLTTNIFGGQAKLDSAEVALTMFDGKIVYRRSS
jgi:predicted amidohydrolase YtcJ